MADPAQVRVELAPGAEAVGFTEMLATMLRQNVDDHPGKKACLRRTRGRVALVITDLGMEVTLIFRGQTVEVHAGIRGVPDLTVRAPSEWHMKMSLAELEPRFGFPDPKGAVNAEIDAATKDGTVEVLGMLTSPMLMLRLTRLMSINAP